jgi:hypothetical protein
MRHATIRIAALGIWLFLLAGCDPISLTLFGVGAGTGVGHTLGGIAYKTFTEPLPKVKKASLTALKRMAIKVNTIEKVEGGENIAAKATDRNISIELEAISANTTRMRTTARKNGALMDSATAVEIIMQTEKALGGQ